MSPPLKQLRLASAAAPGPQLEETGRRAAPRAPAPPRASEPQLRPAAGRRGLPQGQGLGGEAGPEGGGEVDPG